MGKPRHNFRGPTETTDPKYKRNPKPAHRPRHQARTAFGFWVDGSGMTVAEIATKLGVSKVNVYNLRLGKSKPSREKASAIEQLTGGAVPISSW